MSVHTPPAREPLSSVDFAWLRMDDPTNLMHINGVLVLDQPAAFESIRDIIERRLLAIPRFRSRVVVPKRGKPYWEPDPGFDIANHVGSITLPDPGGDDELRAVVEGLISQPFDPAHPMWSFQVIQNFRGGTVVMAKLHHCLGDGVALMLVLLSMTDRTPQIESGARNPFLSLYTRHEKHEEEHLDLDTIRRLAEEIMPDGMRLMLHPAEAFRKVKGWVKAPVATGNLGRLVFRRRDPRTAFKGPLGVPKSVSWSEALPLAEVKAVSKALGATINDVLLSAMTGGLRRYLMQNGGPLPGDDLNFRAAMPVNLRTMERMDQLGNQFGLIFLSLPVGIADPARRLEELKRRSKSLKRSMEPIVVFRILDTLGIVPRMVQDLVVGIFATKATAVMTNVPGPKDVLYLAGKPIQDIFFWVPQAGRVGIGISICSYAGRVRLGVGTDTGLVPDPEKIVTGFHEELEAMRRLAGRTGEMSEALPEPSTALTG